MLIVISGGSGSGKSEYAEDMAVRLYKNMNAQGLVYIATMKPYGSEAEKRIERHRLMRKNKGFNTIECYSGLKELHIEKNGVVLLECMSNLLANELFDEKNQNAVNDILMGVSKISHNAKAMIIVTNEIFSDGILYDAETVNYIKKLGSINRNITQLSNAAAEIVCGIPVYIKGGEECAY